MSRARRRMAIAVLALVGVFVSLYLLLYKLGVYGALACTGGGSCAFVQASSYADFLGIPVAGWGTGWYAAVLGVALAGLRPRFASSPWTSRLLAALGGAGLLFTLYLTWVELFVLEAICQWCVGSAVLVAAIAGLVAWGRLAGEPRHAGRPARPGSPGGG